MKDRRTFFTRYWWVFAGVLSAVALATALNIDNTDGWIVVTNSSNESWTINWNTSKPVTCAAGNYSYWTGTGFSCRDDQTGGGGANLSGYVPYVGATQDLDLDGRHLKVHAINATDSAGLAITSFSLLPVALFGVGSTNNSLFYGSVTFSQNACLGGVCRSTWPADTYANVTTAQADITSIKSVDATQNSSILALQNDIVAFQSSNSTVFDQLTAIKTVDATQNTTLGALQTSNTTVFNQLSAIKTVDNTQNGSISTAQADITAIKTVDATQNGSISTAQADITAIKSVDATQNSSIASVSTFAQTKAATGTVDCGSGNFLRVLTINNGSWSTTCAADSGTGGGLTEFMNFTTSEYATTSNTVYVIMTNLTAPLDANSKYVIKCEFLTYSAAPTTGERLRVNTTGTPTTVAWSFNSQVSATTRTSFQGVSTSSNAFADTGSAGTNVRDITMLTGYIATAANPVTVWYEMVSEISTSNAAYAVGSWCRYTKVG